MTEAVTEASTEAAWEAEEEADVEREEEDGEEEEVSEARLRVVVRLVLLACCVVVRSRDEEDESEDCRADDHDRRTNKCFTLLQEKISNRHTHVATHCVQIFLYVYQAVIYSLKSLKVSQIVAIFCNYEDYIMYTCLRVSILCNDHSCCASLMWTKL